MRWKLLLIASLIASVIGSGATLAIIVFLNGSSKRFASQDIVALSTLIIPIAMIIAASIFVYRHTARRRKTQAMATALLSTILMLAIILASVYCLSKSTRHDPLPQPDKTAFIVEPLAGQKVRSKALSISHFIQSDLFLHGS